MLSRRLKQVSLTIQLSIQTMLIGLLSQWMLNHAFQQTLVRHAEVTWLTLIVLTSPWSVSLFRSSIRSSRLAIKMSGLSRTELSLMEGSVI